MRVAFFIHTSGQAYLWSQVVLALKLRGHQILVMAREHKSVCQLLDNYDIPYVTYGKWGKSRYVKALQLPFWFLRSLGTIKKFKPDIVVGFGTIEAWMGWLFGKPSIIFDDNESRPAIDRLSWSHFATTILTPSCFVKDLGKKHIRFSGYKELAYLHPNHFQPDPAIYTELGLNSQERYIILRFGSFQALHDANRHGFSVADKYHLVEKLSKYARIFISAEGIPPADLVKYRLPMPYYRIHHVLYFADLLIGDTQTMAWEAAVLGTPTVVCTSFTPQFGNFIELEQEYGLLYGFLSADKAIDKALHLIRQPDLKEQWTIKRKRLLADKIDVAQFITDFIVNYPESYRKYGEKGV